MNAPLPHPIRQLLTSCSRRLSASDLPSSDAYARRRHELLCQSRLLRRLRRVELGDTCSVLFENRATVLAHLEEIRFLEGRAWTEERLEREVDAYRVLLPQPGELRATVFLTAEDATLGAAFVSQLAQGRPVLGLRVGKREVVAHSLEEAWDPLCPVLYIVFRLDAQTRQALCVSDDDTVSLWLSGEGGRVTATLPPHTRFQLERDLWEAAS